MSKKGQTQGYSDAIHMDGKRRRQEERERKRKLLQELMLFQPLAFKQKMLNAYQLVDSGLMTTGEFTLYARDLCCIELGLPHEAGPDGEEDTLIHRLSVSTKKTADP